MSNYKKAGVDVDKANKFVSNIKDVVKSTHNCNVLDHYGSFASFYKLSSFKDMKSPVIVSSTDGVGTKLKIAIMADKFDDIGFDLVAMNVNDILVSGAKPLFFLDYIATGQIELPRFEKIISSIASACRYADVSLVGGETAEMPSFYSELDFDLAGFCVGIVDESRIIDGHNVKEGDVVIGLKSSGFHSNGYSLLRSIFFDELNYDLNMKLSTGHTLGDTLLMPTRIYTKEIQLLLANNLIPEACSHITGGGFYDNIKRVIPDNVDVFIDEDSWQKPFCFNFLEECAQIDKRELFSVFNMGIGFVMIYDKSLIDAVINILNKNDTFCYRIGEIKKGKGDINIKFK